MATEVEQATELMEMQTPEAEPEKTKEEETTESSDPAVLEVKEVEKKEEPEPEEELPPMTYVDFLPQCFGSRLEGSEPIYSPFQTVVEQANQWLRTTPQFSAVKCETVDYKLSPTDFSVEPDTCFQHFSSHGKNVYIRGLRLWLMPRTDQSLPVQQLGYITVLPDHSSGNLEAAVSSIQPAAMRINADQLLNEFDTMSATMDKLNHHLQQKPLPGRILTIETLCLKASESDRRDKFNSENTFWTECGKATRLFLFATRIFYVVGSPAFEKVCYYDEVPFMVQNPEDFGLRIKFAPFSQTVACAAAWLAGQKVSVGLYRINNNAAGFTESQGLQESRYVKILRIFYVRDRKVSAAPPALYQSVRLTTRLFLPSNTTGSRSFETFSKTVQRVIAWLQATGTPVLGMETVRYPLNPDREQGVSSDRVDCVVNAFSGQYSLTCIRLYFPCEFQEPPPEVVPETEEDYWGWACVVS
ncbi:uncharacterized protein LOC143275813 [Babylonia areolata]|uniref:uncharacterized protein LOC143275813 n=1 Tax=Babylonia areolata TaxID=304850 RepID=UPI003FD48CCE